MPTALVARLARQGVTVALSGDGGDELFFGYTRYVRALRNWQMLSRVPGPLRRWMGARAQHQGEASRRGRVRLVAAAGLQAQRTTSKVLLKRVLGRYVPQSMVHRPKRGFGAPVSDWLKGDLRPWAEDLLQPARLEREGVLSAAAVQPLWQQFLGGQRKWHTHLWNVLMFQAWQAHWRQVRTRVTGG